MVLHSFCRTMRCPSTHYIHLLHKYLGSFFLPILLHIQFCKLCLQSLYEFKFFTPSFYVHKTKHLTELPTYFLISLSTLITKANLNLEFTPGLKNSKALCAMPYRLTLTRGFAIWASPGHKTDCLSPIH